MRTTRHHREPVELIDIRTAALEGWIAAESRLTATINGALVMCAHPSAIEDIHPVTGGRYFIIDNAWTERSALIQLLVFPSEGHAHVQDGTYRVGQPEAPGRGEAAYFEGSAAGLARFRAKDGWIELRFAGDRSRVEGTFEFTAISDDLGARAIRQGRFLLPYADLPDTRR